MSMRRRIAVLAVALAALAAAAPSHGLVRGYAVTRGSGYGNGDSELIAPTLVLPRGAELVFVNLHLWGHSIYSDAWKAPNVRLFNSDVIPFRGTSAVRGVPDLSPGSYGFFCSNHTGMRGTLVIV